MFSHTQNENGTFNTRCLYCFMTIASCVASPQMIEKLEARHICPERALAELLARRCIVRGSEIFVKFEDRERQQCLLDVGCEGMCGEFPPAMLYIIAHSLSMCAQGREPDAISAITHPSDQMSTAPGRAPGYLPPLITSGDMYIGVPWMVGWRFIPFGAPVTTVLPCLAITLAAPKSTYLITPL